MRTFQRQAPAPGLELDPVQQYLLYDAVDRSPALVFVADDDMNYLAVNQRACEVLGYTRAELLGLRVTDIAVAVEAPAMYSEMIAERSHQGEVELRTKEGALLPFVYQASGVTVAGMQYWVSVGFVDPTVVARVRGLGSPPSH